MSTADKLAYLNETKDLIRVAINEAGGNITPETPFREYANRMAAISPAEIEYQVITDINLNQDWPSA